MYQITKTRSPSDSMQKFTSVLPEEYETEDEAMIAAFDLFSKFRPTNPSYPIKRRLLKNGYIASTKFGRWEKFTVDAVN